MTGRNNPRYGTGEGILDASASDHLLKQTDSITHKYKKRKKNPSSPPQSSSSSMDTAQWPQEIMMKPTEDMVTNNPCSTTKAAASTSLERKLRPKREQALSCPRCNSTNTKFCYYNNYSLTQPRYFCKGCRRYWTDGGSLRNIPIGGGSRKNKRSPPSSKIKLPDLVTASNSSSNPSKIHDGQDLNLGFFPPNPEFRGFCEFIQLPHIERLPPHSHFPTNSTTSSCANAASISAMELLNGLTSSRELMTSFLSMPTISYPNSVFSSGFALQGDFKPNVEGIGSGYGNDGDLQGLQETSNGRLLFPFIEDLKQVSSVSEEDNQQGREQGNSTGYWSGMMGGAGSW
ncbi:hypothetical protein Nepgr_028575 [Nepenthes gracilis]|uniref:Dof zinc finger protein n=1 Tax=Nepenthes gracilis TaxID=150966 RepID=A0AAD3TE33_NEPGR|nr:hypothetical protein Nepgr_028575 [Nepenthes gracilis]